MKISNYPTFPAGDTTTSELQILNATSSHVTLNLDTTYDHEFIRLSCEEIIRLYRAIGGK